MEKKEFLAAVEKEIISIKENATTEEIEKLNFIHLDPLHPTSCIYGQMTGDCENLRSKDLMGKGCTLVFDSLTFDCFEDLILCAHSRESNNSDDWSSKFRNAYYFSALETYIALGDSNNKNVIAFLKGEVKELEL